jgi:UDP-N-acetylmuramyl tripeptide synthase
LSVDATPATRTTLALLDSRRLTGPNLLLDGPGAVIDVRLGEHAPAAFAQRWGGALDTLLIALGWAGAERAWRSWRGGATLAFAAPIDALYAATEVNEWAFAVARAALEPGTDPAPGLEPTIEKLREAIASEANPALLALRDEAHAHDVTFLSDDKRVSVGLGEGSRTWPARRVPRVPARVRWSSVSDVPVALVTGTNGKTTTVRLLGAIARAAGRVAGVTSTDRVEVGAEVVAVGDYSGPNGARTVLRDRRVQVGVLEVARGGILRRGLPVGKAHAAVVTNVAEDHLGEYGIFDLDALAEAKLVVAKAIGREGRVVLNADDSRLRARGAKLAQPVLWCTLDVSDAVVRAHRAAGGDAAWLEDDALWLAHAGVVERVLAVADVPIALGGAARYNVRNALGAIGAAAALGFPLAAIRNGLAAFAPTPESNPGRANTWRFRGGTVAIVDFAHNPHGLEALAETVAAMPAERRAIVLGQAGDRDDESIRALARAAMGMRPEHVFVKEMASFRRGRAAGEVPALLEDELRAAGLAPDRVSLHADELAAVRAALTWARGGDVLLLATHADRAQVLTLLETLAASDWQAGEPLPGR